MMINIVFLNGDDGDLCFGIIYEWLNMLNSGSSGTCNCMRNSGSGRKLIGEMSAGCTASANGGRWTPFPFYGSTSLIQSRIINTVIAWSTDCILLLLFRN